MRIWVASEWLRFDFVWCSLEFSHSFNKFIPSSVLLRLCWREVTVQFFGIFFDCHNSYLWFILSVSPSSFLLRWHSIDDLTWSVYQCQHDYYNSLKKASNFFIIITKVENFISILYRILLNYKCILKWVWWISWCQLIYSASVSGLGLMMKWNMF